MKLAQILWLFATNFDIFVVCLPTSAYSSPLSTASQTGSGALRNHVRWIVGIWVCLLAEVNRGPRRGTTVRTGTEVKYLKVTVQFLSTRVPPTQAMRLETETFNFKNFDRILK